MKAELQLLRAQHQAGPPTQSSAAPVTATSSGATPVSSSGPVSTSSAHAATATSASVLGNGSLTAEMAAMLLAPKAAGGPDGAYGGLNFEPTLAALPLTYGTIDLDFSI